MTTVPLTSSEPGVYAIPLSRDWGPVCEGVEGRYAAIWGVGEFAQVVVQIREVPVEDDQREEDPE